MANGGVLPTRRRQNGFINGYYDCFKHDVRRTINSIARDEEFRKAVSDFYHDHGDRLPTPVPSVLDHLAKTLKSQVPLTKGGEVWSEPHGYFDGLWWKQLTPKGQIGYLEGYLRCYTNNVRRPRARFSSRAEKYQELITRYYENPKHDEEQKIAYVLYRFRDRQDSRRR